MPWLNLAPHLSEVAGVQLSHDSVTVPGGDLRACSEPKPVSGRWGEGEDYSIEGTAMMIQTSLKCVHAHTNCSSSRLLVQCHIGSKNPSFSKMQSEESWGAKIAGGKAEFSIPSLSCLVTHRMVFSPAPLRYTVWIKSDFLSEDNWLLTSHSFKGSHKTKVDQTPLTTWLGYVQAWEASAAVLQIAFCLPSWRRNRCCFPRQLETKQLKSWVTRAKHLFPPNLPPVEFRVDQLFSLKLMQLWHETPWWFRDIIQSEATPAHRQPTLPSRQTWTAKPSAFLGLARNNSCFCWIQHHAASLYLT